MLAVLVFPALPVQVQVAAWSDSDPKIFPCFPPLPLKGKGKERKRNHIDRWPAGRASLERKVLNLGHCVVKLVLSYAACVTRHTSSSTVPPIFLDTKNLGWVDSAMAGGATQASLPSSLSSSGLHTPF